jgi:hypothetical protein
MSLHLLLDLLHILSDSNLALAVGLPDVHLRAAVSEVAGAGVRIVGRRLPVLAVDLNIKL